VFSSSLEQGKREEAEAKLVKGKGQLDRQLKGEAKWTFLNFAQAASDPSLLLTFHAESPREGSECKVVGRRRELSESSLDFTPAKITFLRGNKAEPRVS
jgi:hypothetical protein